MRNFNLVQASKYLKIIFLLIILAGCKSNIEKKIGVASEHCSSDTKCEIVISQLTDFKWDRMFVFDPPRDLSVMNDAMRVDYSKHYEEFTRAIVFLNLNHIVYFENNPADIEDVVDKQVIFNYPDSLLFQVYTPANAKFNVTKKSSGDRTFYWLSKSVK